MPDILNQGPAFSLPPDFLNDGDGDGKDYGNGDFHIPTHNDNRVLPHSYYSAFPPPKLPYSSTHQYPLQDLTYYFPPHLSKHSQKPLMVPVSPQPTLAGPSFKSTHVTPNGFLFTHPPPPPQLPPSTLNENYDPLKQNISTIPICGNVYCSHQPFMFQNQNRQGNRVFGGSEIMGSPPHSAWPALSHQRPNTPPVQGGSCMRGVFLNGSHEVMRKRAGTGVFLPRQYGNPISVSPKKPGLLTPPDQVPARKNPVPIENPFIQNEARGRKVHEVMNQQQQRLNLRTEGGNNELCLPHEWAY